MDWSTWQSHSNLRSDEQLLPAPAFDSKLHRERLTSRQMIEAELGRSWDELACPLWGV